MGIGGGIFLIALGAILVFAVHAHPAWLDLSVVGWVLMLAGAAVLGLTIWFWRQRRVRRRLTMVERTQIAHDPAGVVPLAPEPPDAELPHGPPAL